MNDPEALEELVGEIQAEYRDNGDYESPYEAIDAVLERRGKKEQDLQMVDRNLRISNHAFRSLPDFIYPGITYAEVSAVRTMQGLNDLVREGTGMEPRL